LNFTRFEKSESPGTGANPPLFQSALACSIRYRELEANFHQTWRVELSKTHSLSMR
jgi:hypothetical protein